MRFPDAGAGTRRPGVVGLAQDMLGRLALPPETVLQRTSVGRCTWCGERTAWILASTVDGRRLRACSSKHLEHLMREAGIRVDRGQRCAHCGQWVLTPDIRGGCPACGAPLGSAPDPEPEPTPPEPPPAHPVMSIDVSWWQDKPMPWVALKRAGVSEIIVRMWLDRRQDERAPMHIRDALKAAARIRGYGWGDPTVRIPDQVKAAVQAVEQASVVIALASMAVDAQQYWKDWNKWWAALRGEIPRSQIPVFSSRDLSEFYRLLCAEIETAIRPVPVELYTGTWLVNEWARQMLEWMHRYRNWIAHYIDRGVAGAGYVVTAERLKEIAAGVGQPWLLAGQPKASRRQFSSTMILLPTEDDGVGCWRGKLDWNVELEVS